MINLRTNDTLLLKDGSSRQATALEYLNPSYAQAEGRSTEELILEARAIAKELSFFNDQNEQGNDTWESFFLTDNTGFKDNDTRAKEWAAQLAAYMENPEIFNDNEEVLKRMSQPHTVLFATFLQLLHHIKSQINGLTQKHLDFYFYERLKLQPKKAQPDVVNILLELAENADQLEIREGTVFLAGTDTDGNELQYTVTEDTLINKSKVAHLKSVFVDKAFSTLEEIHLNYQNSPEEVLEAMFELALGVPEPGNSLPAMPDKVENLDDLHKSASDNDTAAIAYINQQLYLSVENFDFIMQVHQLKDHLADEWLRVFSLLKTAHQSKVKKQREETFKAIHENGTFHDLMRHVYGEPNPGNSLPFYNGKELDIAQLYNDFNDDSLQTQAVTEIIEEDLKLSIADFLFIYENSVSADSTDENWNRVYQILELANRQYRQLSLPNPTTERTVNIYAAEDTKALGFRRNNDEAESLRFKTFGNLQEDAGIQLQHAKLGYGISSPILLLKEAERKITLLHDLDLSNEDFKTFSKIIEQDVFRIQLSGEDGWFLPQRVEFSTGSIINQLPLSAIEITDIEISKASEKLFRIHIADPIPEAVSLAVAAGSFVIDDDKNIYEVLSISSADFVDVRQITDKQIMQSDSIVTGIYASKDVYLNGFKISISLTDADDTLVPLTESTREVPKSTELPSILIQLNQDFNSQLRSSNEMAVFDNFMSAKIKKIHLKTAVSGLKNGVIQNDLGSLNPKKPFEPFGNRPEVGSNFYFTHEELAEKVISKLRIQFEWMNQPEDFGAYYQNYIDTNSAETNPIKSGEDFKVSLFLQEDFNEMLIGQRLALFNEDQTIEIDNIVEKLADSRPGFRYGILDEADQSTNEITNWRRYFKLELTPKDFQHQLYNQLLFQNAATGGEVLNQPYVPKLRNISFAYEAETEVVTENGTVDENACVFEIHPFGYNTISDQDNLTLIPEYLDNGSLLLGIDNTQPQQVISILFQLADGSANPDIDKPDLEWSYLKSNTWHLMPVGDIISDTTEGFRRTGIVRLRIPNDATSGGNLLPDSSYWIKVSVANKIDGIPDTIAIRSQVISARLSSEVVASSHYDSPLSPDSIVETEEFFPEIAAIAQPYTSINGKPKEDDSLFYRRISERIRHKNRALTVWDYEQLVLENFPEIFKVKCMSNPAIPGDVMLTVIPDIREKLPFDPFTPKVSSNTLAEIGAFLKSRVSIHARLAVSNPFYAEVKIRCTVKFNKGVDQLFFQARLNEELKKFLSPWAYDHSNDIRIGGVLESGVLVNFIAEQEYVDFVANLRIFQTIDGETSDVTVLNDGRNAVIPHRPDMVITSSEIHQIDLVDENEYDEDSETGINYMVIEEDFIVAQDIVKN
ncbi:MAG: baseplate J/gp47 family protein [Bacteroidota bacterium]